LPLGARVLTHCNAGALATAGYGTALGMVRAAFEAGNPLRVLAGETRPFLQGARLTAWELKRDGIPVTVITDGMAGWLMSRGEISCVVVGADRIARNGDVANKVGTYGVALACRAHGVPFVVAAPTTTVDLACPDGASIPIEMRGSGEVVAVAGRGGVVRVAPDGIQALYPAFDVTPAALVDAIVTERGVSTPPHPEGLRWFPRHA
jgi:methylthioribose-1-phosphate isomerase